MVKSNNQCPQGFEKEFFEGICWGVSEGEGIKKECWTTDCEYFSPTICPRGYRMIVQDNKCHGFPEKDGSIKEECVKNCEFVDLWDDMHVIIGDR